MTVVVVGLSHLSAPVSVLERAAVAASDVPKLSEELRRCDVLSEALVLATCNRVEVYADAARFHPAVADIAEILSRHAGMEVSELTEHLYVHFADAAVEHMFNVASGLDSMVVGESQILGQLRSAYTDAGDLAAVGTVLHNLTQTALRVGKRVHTDTGIDHAGASIVAVALNQAETVLGPLAGRRAVIVGAGSMGALAGATLRRRGVEDIVLVNRSLERAQRLADALPARAADFDALGREAADADILISCTGATGLVIDRDLLAGRERELVVLDIALPRDVDPGVAELPGVTYVDLEALRGHGADVSEDDVAAAHTIVADELAGYLTAQQQLAVAPTVTALRARADAVIEGELARLDQRLPSLTGADRREVAGAVRRAVEKLLHEPTVRVKELAGTPGGDSYASVLRELFGLDPAAVESVASAKTGKPGSQGGTGVPGGPR